MERRELGRSGLAVPPVMFGAWAIGGLHWGGSDDAVAADAIRASIDAGVDAVDTAPIYGFGRSERVVGEAIKGRRDGVFIATKCGQPWDWGEGRFSYRLKDDSGTERAVYLNLKPESVVRECEESLRRLGVEVIDLYQCHLWDRSSPPDVFMEGLLRLKEQGKIRAIGLSNFPFDVLRGCVAVGQVDSYQPRYNALDRDIEDDLLPFCRSNNLAVLVYSPLERGLLTGAMTDERTFRDGDDRKDFYKFNRENRRRLAAILASLSLISDRHGATFAQMMINWTIHQPGITAALVGARTPEQARENAGSLKFVLNEEERSQIGAAFKGFEFVGRPAWKTRRSKK